MATTCTTLLRMSRLAARDRRLLRLAGSRRPTASRPQRHDRVVPRRRIASPIWWLFAKFGGLGCILADEGRYDGLTPPLTAAQAMDLTDVAAVLSCLTGRHVDREVVTDEEQATRLKGRGLPPATVEITMSIYRAARAGEFAQINPTLARLIGRQPATIMEELACALGTPKAGGDQRHQSG